MIICKWPGNRRNVDGNRDSKNRYVRLRTHLQIIMKCSNGFLRAAIRLSEVTKERWASSPRSEEKSTVRLEKEVKCLWTSSTDIIKTTRSDIPVSFENMTSRESLVGWIVFCEYLFYWGSTFNINNKVL